MDESLTDEERAALKVSAIASLRQQEAELARSHELHRDRLEERGSHLLRPPIHHTLFADAVLDLRRAGEAVPDYFPGPLHTIEHRQGGRGRKMQMIDASSLLAAIRRVLAIVDPAPE